MTPSPLHTVNFGIPTVSALIERNHDGQMQILLQKRLSPPESLRSEPEYHNTWELPQGKLEQYENLFEGLKREVLEETGLTIVKTRPDTKSQIYSPKNDGAFAFECFCGIQQLKAVNGKPWIGFVFICEIDSGAEPVKTEEAGEFKWFTKLELKELIEKTPEEVFTYNLGALELYLKS